MQNAGIRNIEVFFKEPSLPPIPYDSLHSSLYLLRREIYACLGIDPGSRKEIRKSKALWAAAILILSGFDLLAKFFSGSDGPGVGKRYKKFLTKYIPSFSEEDAGIIFQLRNAMIHSFGLYGEDRKGKIYKFVLVTKSSHLLQQVNDSSYKIGILTLHKQFIKTIKKYHSDLLNDKQLRIRFNKIFPKYGGIYIWYV